MIGDLSCRYGRLLRSARSGLAALRGWRRVNVAGPSMSPTLRDGDRLLVHRTPHIAPGDVVLARYRSMPDRFVVKRALRPEGSGWWLGSDNPFAGGDSAAHGAADVLARVVLRWPRRGRPRRVARSGR